jgi:hypothetical protein
MAVAESRPAVPAVLYDVDEAAEALRLSRSVLYGKLQDLSSAEVDQWLAGLSLSHSTRTVQEIRVCLSRSVKRAMARDKVKRNVVELTEVPTGQPGRRSKSLSAEQPTTY